MNRLMDRHLKYQLFGQVFVKDSNYDTSQDVLTSYCNMHTYDATVMPGYLEYSAGTGKAHDFA